MSTQPAPAINQDNTALPFLAHIPAREIALGDYLPWCETVKAPNRIKVPDCRDPLDRPFLELALTARADALITGDKDLLDLSETFGVPILTPAAFRVRLDHRAGAGHSAPKLFYFL